MNSNKVLTKEAVKGFLTKKPGSDDERWDILNEVESYTELTLDGLNELIRRWRRWDVYHRMYLSNIAEISDELLACLVASGVQFEIGLLQLSKKSAQLMVQSNAPTSPVGGIALKELEELSLQTAKILVNAKHINEVRFIINGRAKMEKETIQLLLSEKNCLVLVRNISVANINLLNEKKAGFIFNRLVLDELSDEEALAFADLFPWVDRECICQAEEVPKQIKAAKKAINGKRKSSELVGTQSDINDFDILRNKIAEDLPVQLVTPENRFVSRIRACKKELKNYISGARDIIDDSHRRLVIECFKNPSKPDRGLYIRTERTPAVCNEGGIANAYVRMGAWAAHYCYDLRETIFQDHGGGQEWVKEWIEEALKYCEVSPAASDVDFSYHNYWIDVDLDGADVAVCGGQARILTAQPSVGDEWTNYVVVPNEICDFINTVLFPKYVAMYIGYDFVDASDASDVFEGTFVLIERSEVWGFVEKMKYLSNKI